MPNVRNRRPAHRGTCPKCKRENVAYTIVSFNNPIEHQRGQKIFYKHNRPDGTKCE